MPEMPEQFSEKMGAIRIYSKGAGQQHRGPNLANPPQPWTPIGASRYVIGKRKLDWFFGELSLAQVVSQGIPGSKKPVLIIVHMYRGGGWDQATVGRQAEVIEQAKSRSIPIFVVQKTIADASDKTKNRAAIKATLPDVLAGAVDEYGKLYYYAEESLGNALEGRTCKTGQTLRDTLQGIGADVAIVFGQTYGMQCVDSTILGMCVPPFLKEKFHDPYSPGLLNIGVDVVTARNVLERPPAPGEIESQYFSFEMKDDISLDKPASKPESPEKSALTAPTKAPVEYAKDAPTEKAATQAPTHA